MRPPRRLPRLPAILTASLALAASTAASAQAVPRPRLQNAQEAGVARVAMFRQEDPVQSAGGLGPGMDVRFPDDPSLVPFLSQEMQEGAKDPNAPSQITPRFLESMGLITDSYDRCRALLDLAREAILSNQLLLAHRTLEQASLAAMAEPPGLRHDQLIIEAVMTTPKLTDALIREGRTQPSLLDDPAVNKAAPLPARRDPKQLVRLARLEWQRAAALAARISNPTYRSEYKARVAEGMSQDSSKIVSEYTRRDSSDALQENERFGPEDVRHFENAAGALLDDATRLAGIIERPIWKYAALERVAIFAGESRQFARGLSVGRSIENAEARAQALILLAESEARANQPDDATTAYAEAAEAISRVERNGLRGVLTGYLVDSLITTGRFEDARACLVLYPTESERFVALGAIAESQGRRGGAAKAREWIAAEAPAQYRSALYRRVNNGVLTAVGNERQNQYAGPRSELPVPAPAR